MKSEPPPPPNGLMDMNLLTEPYLPQSGKWPPEGRVILAQFDAESVIVYQAYRPEIGHFAATHGYFGGPFKLTRMSWIKPNFLWMMYRSGWGTKQGQEVVLAIRLRRDAFDEILQSAVHSSYKPQVYGTRADWQSAVASSNVRLQWDPDHSPNGAKLERRAIQLGLRGDVLASYAKDWILEIIDISSFVASQRPFATTEHFPQLVVPSERAYPVSDVPTATRLGLAPPELDSNSTDSGTVDGRIVRRTSQDAEI